VHKLYETNRYLFWLITCILAGIVWGLFQSTVWGAVIYAALLFIFALIYELFFNKNNQANK
jgi:hypothetical protein